MIIHSSKSKLKSVSTDINLSTKLVDCAFNFGPRFTDFFIEQTKDKRFKFTADMVVTAKAVKEKLDDNFTLGDLLEIKYDKKTYVKFDNSSCQWNKFLKDFCADQTNDIYANKIKTASKFWKILRNSDLPKVYTRTFIEANKFNI